MNFELKLTDATNAYIIKNLWPLYVHEVSVHGSELPNEHGVLSDDAELASLATQGETQNAWWEKPESLFPYLIYVDGVPAGFNLIATAPYIPEGADVEFVVYELFLLHAFRGKGVAERAVHAGFDRHQGRWEIVTHPTNPRAIAFWRRALRAQGSWRFEERTGAHHWGQKVIFTFDNTGA